MRSTPGGLVRSALVAQCRRTIGAACGSSRPGKPRRRWPIAAVDVLGRSRPGRRGRRRPAVARLHRSSAIVGQHPQPGAGSERCGPGGAGGRRAAVPADAELIVLLSGGASSLMAVPADGITLDDKRRSDRRPASRRRRHLRAQYRAQASVGHQGRTAGGAPPRRQSRRFVLSDVVGDDLSVIASGPTVADPSTLCAMRWRVLERFGGMRRISRGRRDRTSWPGARGERPETPKPGDPRLARADDDA